ncbi:bifunctional diguanylate cyclase/phosphodiesterase [Clostridium vincentii]|uniref:Phytochrome-like protein cph2 n=1 Tax=Clostridium vincentii TaxID=52704 RepID=A0A2T0BIJ9_9CLOT|nr:bifunctional diguanylate cyclase/phosphodiesterase [Clostridium vincentii]PRR83691.1 Phytochrome-like protein cph2 [Clostridium vincentii]
MFTKLRGKIKSVINNLIDGSNSGNKLLELSEERYKTLIDNSKDIIYSCDKNGLFTAVNKQFLYLIKIHYYDIIGKKLSNLICKKDYYIKWEEAIQKVIKTEQMIDMEFKVDENAIYNVTISPVFDNKNNVVGITGTNYDITEIRKSESIIKHMAYYDNLTGLHNRAYFFDRLNKHIQISKEKSKKLVVIFIDIDDFKRINDSLGHTVGDELLKLVAKRLQLSIRKGDTIARISGDEFSIVINKIKNVNESIHIIEDILKVFEVPFNVQNSLINITISIGASVFPDDGKSAEELLRNSDIAMYKVKESGKNFYRYFDINMKNELLRKMKIETMLVNAVENEEFILHYQPQYDVRSKKICGLEALIRWNSSELGFLNPMEFIAISEEIGIISKIGEWVLNRACNFAKKINNEFGTNIVIAVNISPIQLRQGDFYNIVTKIIDKIGISPCNVELEITENICIDDFDYAINILKSLKKYGVRIALDDFGTGYSSLSYLKKLPIDMLKIDKSFVDEISIDGSQNDLTETIISLAHKLGMKALAEGVEDQFQYDYLEKSGIDIIQGYLLGKPMTESAIEKELSL